MGRVWGPLYTMYKSMRVELIATLEKVLNGNQFTVDIIQVYVKGSSTGGAMASLLTADPEFQKFLQSKVCQVSV